MTTRIPTCALLGLAMAVMLNASCSSGPADSSDLPKNADLPETSAGETSGEDLPLIAKDTGSQLSDITIDVLTGETWDVPEPEDAPDLLDDTGTELWLPVDAEDMTSELYFADLAPETAPQDVGQDTEEDQVEQPPLLFDLALIQDASTAGCTFTDHHTVFKNNSLVDVWKVTYVSFESIDGELVPIQIKGFAARPVLAGDNLPGVVQAHGLGGFAKEEHATGTAALLGMFVLAYTGPGGGDAADNTSEGLPAGWDDGYRMFDTIPDVRGTWFWGHAVAAMRGLTCLEHHPDVDPTRLGMTGFSAGGVATLIASSVDPRIKAAVPLSASLAWDVATLSPDAWQHNLLSKAGLSTASEQWETLIEQIAGAQALLPASQAKVMMVNGSTDEFFPLTAHVECFDALPGTDKRTSISANFDHGCFALTGVESADTIEARAALRAEGGQRMWFRHWFGTDGDYGYVPQAPQVTVQPVGVVTIVTALVDGGGSKLDVENVKVWFSNDDSFLYGSVELKSQGNGLYAETALFPVQGNTITYVDVQYKTKDLLFPERFSISSVPVIPAGLVPHIRNVETCL